MAALIRATWKYILLPLFISLFVFYVLQTPKYSGIEIFHNKYNPITIKRDRYGVPSIESKTLRDTLYGLGYAQAQDRLWALHSRKMLVSGRISEIAGEKTLEIDKFFRNAGLQRYCKYALEYADDEIKDLYQAFADGINDYAASAKILPLEFWLTWSKFEPYTILDAATNAKFISFFLTFDFQFEFMYDTLERLVGPTQAADLLPFKSEHYFWSNVTVMNDDDLKQVGIFEEYDKNRIYTNVSNFAFPEERRPPIQDSQVGQKSQQTSQTKTSSSSEQTSNKEVPKKTPEKQTGKKASKENAEKVKLNMPEADVGSNSWVIHGNHTATGKPILANDPHLMNSIPTVWYPASLHYDGNYVAGAALLGFPGVHIGKTKHASWAITTLCSDTTDLFVLKTEGDKYFYEGAWHPMQAYKETIHVRGRKEPVEITVYETHHGVVLDHYFPELFVTRNFRPREGVRYALAWPGYQKKDTGYTAFFEMYKATKPQDFFDAWEHALQPAFSLLFATTKGDIGFIGLGKIPIRKIFNSGIKTRDGTSKDDDWLGYMPWKDQPKIANPKKGYIVSANNKMTTDNLRWQTSATLFPTSRAMRIDEMIREHIAKNEKITVNHIITMQNDTVDVLAREVTPIMVARTKDALPKGYNLRVGNEKLSLLLDSLVNWDYSMGKQSTPAAIFNVWERFFIRKELRKIGLSDIDHATMLVNAKFDHFLFRKILAWKSSVPYEHDIWCKTDENEKVADPCLYNLVTALEEAWIFLEKHFGSDVSEWHWGAIHKMDYPHGTFSQTPLKPFFHRSVPAVGNGRTVNVARMRMDSDSFAGVWSANLKVIVSLLEGDKSYFITDTGVSGNVFSEHYDDQMKLLHEQKYLEIYKGEGGEWKDVLYLNFK